MSLMTDPSDKVSCSNMCIQRLYGGFFVRVFPLVCCGTQPSRPVLRSDWLWRDAVAAMVAVTRTSITTRRRLMAGVVPQAPVTTTATRRSALGHRGAVTPSFRPRTTAATRTTHRSVSNSSLLRSTRTCMVWRLHVVQYIHII